MISAPASGTGKTTVMLGLLRALSEDGLVVQPFKSGPDYIDPAFHRAACGRASFNLDTWAMGPGLLGAHRGEARGGGYAWPKARWASSTAWRRRASPAPGSSAETARRMGWPVVLVLDVGGQAQSAAATALGFALRPDLPGAGVILNRVASPRHERLAGWGWSGGLPVLGALPRRGDLTLPERHLGLVQAVEHPDLEAAIAGYAAFLRAHVDLAAIRAAAGGTAQRPARSRRPPRSASHWRRTRRSPSPIPICWRAGAQRGPRSCPSRRSPTKRPTLGRPLWLPGGYPELHAGRLAAADRFLRASAPFAETRPVHGECGGYMALGDGADRQGRARATGWRGCSAWSPATRSAGCTSAIAAPSLWRPPPASPGAGLRGHEFHYSTILDQPDAPLAARDRRRRRARCRRPARIGAMSRAPSST
jgi:cobyrinic acid a,c-diamide synthase